MARINLLPWREAQKKQNLNEFLVMILIGLLLTGGVMGAWHFHNEQNIEFQKKRNNYLKKEITAVEARIREIKELERKKAELIARMNVITQLQSSRPQIVRLMDEIVTTLPDGVYLTSVKQSGNGVSFDGKAQSNARVSSYMRNIESTRWLSNPKLSVIQNSNRTNDGYRSFKLSASQVQPKKKDEQQ